MRKLKEWDVDFRVRGSGSVTVAVSPGDQATAEKNAIEGVLKALEVTLEHAEVVVTNIEEAEE